MKMNQEQKWHLQKRIQQAQERLEQFVRSSQKPKEETAILNQISKIQKSIEIRSAPLREKLRQLEAELRSIREKAQIETNKKIYNNPQFQGIEELFLFGSPGEALELVKNFEADIEKQITKKEHKNDSNSTKR